MKSEPAFQDSLDIKQLAAMFQMLSDKTRLQILLMLSAGDQNVSTICKILKLPQPTVSHHLGLLRTGNLVAGHRLGKQIFYGLTVDRGDPKNALKFALNSYEVEIVRHGTAAT